MPIPAPALPAARDHRAFFRRVEIGEQDAVIGVVDERSERDADNQIIAAQAVHLFAHAGFAARGFPVMFPGEVEQRVFVRIGNEDDVPTVASIAAVRSALGNELLSPERDAPRPAVAGLYV